MNTYMKCPGFGSVSSLMGAPAGSVPKRRLEGAPLVLLIAGSEALGIDGWDALRGPHSSDKLCTSTFPISLTARCGTTDSNVVLGDGRWRHRVEAPCAGRLEGRHP